MKTEILRNINRLKVFNFCKAFMLAQGRCPNGTEVALGTHLSLPVALGHMRAIAQADGLPQPVKIEHHSLTHEELNTQPRRSERYQDAFSFIQANGGDARV